MESLSEKCPKDVRPWIHYGLTSNDLVDTSNSMQMRDSLQIIEAKVAKMALLLSKRAVQHGKIPAVGRTHGQHASIISFGLKFANWAAEMAKHIERIEQLKERILICKTLGVVGTGSLMGAKMSCLTNRIRKDVVEVTKRMTNFELSETHSFMDNYVAALFLPHTNIGQFPKLKERLERRRASQQRFRDL